MSETFCPLPWVHQATYSDGSIILCCVAEKTSTHNLNRGSLKEAFHSQDWNQVRRQMLDGEQPAACKRCWEEEKSGYRSHRVTEMQVWRERIGEDGLRRLREETEADGRINLMPRSLDLRLGNTCNLQCVMCRPQDSSKWVGLAKRLAEDLQSPELIGEMKHKLSLDQNDFEWQNGAAFWDELGDQLPHLDEMIIGGGEPMLLEPHFRFLERCVSSGHASKIQLRYHTNLTILPKEILSLWQEFKLVEVFASIDALMDKNHYVRHPAKWDDIERNLRLLDTLSYAKVRTMILCSVHLLTLFHLDQFLDWLQGQNFKTVTRGYNGLIHPGIVLFPEYLSVQTYPAHVKNIVSDKILAFERRSRKPSHKIQGVLNYMFERDQSARLPQALAYIKSLDRVRGTSFERTFPDLAELLGVGPTTSAVLNN